MNPLGTHTCHRMLDVLTGQARGLSNRQIAAELGTSEATVRAHADQLATVLGATSPMHAIALGFRYGLLDRDQITPTPQITAATHAA